jgi:hypothetical protein
MIVDEKDEDDEGDVMLFNPYKKKETDDMSMYKTTDFTALKSIFKTIIN